MTDFSSILTADQQKEILEQKLLQFAVEGYQIELNKQIAEKAGNDASVKQAEDTLNELNIAIEIYGQKLSLLSQNS